MIDLLHRVYQRPRVLFHDPSCRRPPLPAVTRRATGADRGLGRDRFPVQLSPVQDRGPGRRLIHHRAQYELRDRRAAAHRHAGQLLDTQGHSAHHANNQLIRRTRTYRTYRRTVRLLFVANAEACSSVVYVYLH